MKTANLNEAPRLVACDTCWREILKAALDGLTWGSPDVEAWIDRLERRS